MPKESAGLQLDDAPFGYGVKRQGHETVLHILAADWAASRIPVHSDSLLARAPGRPPFPINPNPDAALGRGGKPPGLRTASGNE